MPSKTAGAGRQHGVTHLKYVRLRQVKYLGQTSFELLDPQGDRIHAFTTYVRTNKFISMAFRSQKRYAEALALFIDYLYSAKVMGGKVIGELPDLEYLNRVIDAYPILLRDGSEKLISRIKAGEGECTGDGWLIQVAEELKREPYAPASFDNTLPPINQFLRLSQRLAASAYQHARHRGITFDEKPDEQFIRAIADSVELTPFEKKNLRLNSLLGSVMHARNDEGMERPRGLAVGGITASSDRPIKDFPQERMINLINACIYWRDKALYALLAASGIRWSEALNLTWADIDWANREVYVRDPHFHRFGRYMTPEEKLRYKGRIVSWTYLIEPYKTWFFEALLQYRKLEYVVPAGKRFENDYVFQYVTRDMRGQPLVLASETALNNSFKRACARAGIPGPITKPDEEWWLHCLRHMYGMHLVNNAWFTEADGSQRRLTDAEIQLLMGHKNINSTLRYTQRRKEDIKAGLERSDREVLGQADTSRLAMPEVKSRRLKNALEEQTE